MTRQHRRTNALESAGSAEPVRDRAGHRRARAGMGDGCGVARDCAVGARRARPPGRRHMARPGRPLSAPGSPDHHGGSPRPRSVAVRFRFCLDRDAPVRRPCPGNLRGRAGAGDRVPGCHDRTRRLADRPVDDRWHRSGFPASGLLPADRRRRPDWRERRRRGSLACTGGGLIRYRDNLLGRAWLGDLEPAVHPPRAALRARPDAGDRTRHTRRRWNGLFRSGGPDRGLRGLLARRVRDPDGPGPGPAHPGLPQAFLRARVLVLHLLLCRRRG
jgi:hypothetical protein